MAGDVIHVRFGPWRPQLTMTPIAGKVAVIVRIPDEPTGVWRVAEFEVDVQEILGLVIAAKRLMSPRPP